jgi:hypothetical protein
MQLVESMCQEALIHFYSHPWKPNIHVVSQTKRPMYSQVAEKEKR